MLAWKSNSRKEIIISKLCLNCCFVAVTWKVQNLCWRFRQACLALGHGRDQPPHFNHCSRGWIAETALKFSCDFLLRGWESKLQRSKGRKEAEARANKSPEALASGIFSRFCFKKHSSVLKGLLKSLCLAQNEDADLESLAANVNVWSWSLGSC